MKVVRFLVVVALFLAALAPPAAAAPLVDRSDRYGSRPSVVPADRVAGTSGARLLGDWYIEGLSRPAAESPFGGNADLCLDLGRRARVRAPMGGVQVDNTIEMTCRVRSGRPVVMVMASSDCSSAESGDFHAVGERAQQACAVRTLLANDIRSINLSVDGRDSVDIHRPAFFQISNQRHVVFDEDAVFQATPGPATFAAAAWMAEIRGLTAGRLHTVRAVTRVVVGGEPTEYTFIVHFDVRGH